MTAYRSRNDFRVSVLQGDWTLTPTRRKRKDLLSSIRSIGVQASVTRTEFIVDNSPSYDSSSPLSMNIDELSQALGGSGRALLAWDCYRIGIDPVLFFDSDMTSHSILDSAVLSLLNREDQDRMRDLPDLLEKRSTSPDQHEIRQRILTCMPTRRHSQSIGKRTLIQLSEMYERSLSVASDKFGKPKHPPPPPPPHSNSPQGTAETSEILSNPVVPRRTLENSVATLEQIQVSSDGTTKLLLKLSSDGALIESVIIPVFAAFPHDKHSTSPHVVSPSSSTTTTSSKSPRPSYMQHVSSSGSRSTLCVSSQVGCRQACTFCATGRMGKLRDLTVDEILIQLYYANKVIRVFHSFLVEQEMHPNHNHHRSSSTPLVVDLPPIDNVVFMGMGEPSDNPFAVVHAASIMTERRLFGLAQCKVTISTVAPTPQAFEMLGIAPAVLAWSVHAVRDSLRKQLVPTTRYSMVELRNGLVQALIRRPSKLRTTMWEVTLIDGVNDSIQEAEELSQFALEMMSLVPKIKLVVNLIPFNDIGHSTYKKPSWERVRQFQKILMGNGIVTFVRVTRGDDESAACGQLATKKKMLMALQE